MVIFYLLCYNHVPMQTAIFKTGGKQYSVKIGSLLRVERLPGDVDSEIVFDQVLMVRDGDNIEIGAPRVSGAKVTAKVRSQGRHNKIEIIKFKRRKHHLKKQGHRQHFTEICVSEIDKGIKNGS